MKRNYSKVLLAALAFVGSGIAQQAWADKVVTSTADNPKWFQIVAKRETRLMTDNGVGQNMTGALSTTAPAENNKWRFEQNTDGSWVIVSQKGDYIDPEGIKSLGDTYNNSAFQPVSTKPSTGWTITETASGSDYYTIASGNKQLHQGNNGTSYCIINYGGGSNTSDEGCLFTFKPYSARTAAQSAYDASVEGTNPGQTPAAARTALKAVLDKTDATENELEAALATFNAALVKVEIGKIYYIVSGPSPTYCQGKYMYSPGSGQQSKFGAKVSAPTYAWTFTDAGDGKYYMQNFGTKQYLNTTSTKNTTTAETATTKYSIVSLGQGSFNIQPDGTNPLHAQNDLSVIVVWAGGLNTASAWKFEEVPESERTTPTTFSGVTGYPGTQTYAPGQKDQVLMKFVASVTPGWTDETFTANSITLDLGATQATDLEKVKVYTSTNDDFVSNGQRSATLVGTASSITDNTVKVYLADGLTEGVSFKENQRFYVTADIKADAAVGHKFDVALTGFTYNTDQTATITTGNPEGQGVIYKVQSAPYQPYDLGSHYWRIPAMVVLHHQKDASKNGRVVTMADNRFDHNSDLPSHIDVYERHSDDNGATWSDHKMVVGTDADHALVGGGHGFGDVALVECASGKIIAMMVGGTGYFSSTPSNPNVPVIITSTDGGDTWSAPRTLKDELYNTTYTEGTVQGSFAGSGRGLMLQRQKDESRNGRVMFAMSHRFVVNNANNIQEYIIYSDDEGETWKFSTQSAYSGGDESKLVELADGTVMISVRQSGQRGYNTSTDGGITWGAQAKWADISGNACNGDILYVNKHVLLHSYPNNGNRKNVTIKASFDNGKSWSNPYVVCAPGSCYSTMDVTKDGDIAIFYEDNACSTGFVMNYVVLPTSFIYEGDLSQKALDAAIATAKKITDATTGYETISEAKGGQCSKETYDALAALIPTAEAMTSMTDDQKDDLASKLEEAFTTACTTLCVVDGKSNETTFTISTYENIDDAAPKYMQKNATAGDANDYEWLLIPSTSTYGQVYIKGKDEANYLNRSSNTLTAATTPQAWNVIKGEGEYWHFKSTVNNSTYLAVNKSGGAFNYINQLADYNTWSTKFVLNAVGTVTAVDGVNVVTPAEPTRYYDLQGRRVMNPTKGIFITNTGRKVIK